MVKDMEKKTVPVCHKNQELILDITDLGTDGEGIGRIDGYTLFVKDALIGDKVRVKVIKTKKRFGYARLLEVIEPSRWRVEPVCPVARQCGGCQLQHCSYDKQLAWKEQKIADCISRIGGIPVVTQQGAKAIDSQPDKDRHTGSEAALSAKNRIEPAGNPSEEPAGDEKKPVIMEPILGMDEPYHYRNKAQFPVGYDKEGHLVTGFYAGRTHSIIPCTDCAIQHPSNQVILETVLAFMEEYHISAYREEEHTGLVRHILIRVGQATGEVMVCLIINGSSLPHQKVLVDRLLNCPINGTVTSICLNRNQKKTNVILGDEIETIYGKPYIDDYIGAIRYRISPLSFYQVNPLQTQKLYETALEYADLKGGETVWDLYCGIGTISLFLAQKAAKVYGVEIVPQAIEDARINAELNDMENTEFFVGAAEEVVPCQYEKSGGSLKADVVTIDPPRKGCDEKLLETVIRMKPKRIVYVSCDPATLARDLKYLCARGYELKRVRGCDMFGMSGHVETVVGLHRKDM